jgi:hypothetical protein
MCLINGIIDRHTIGMFREETFHIKERSLYTVFSHVFGFIIVWVKPIRVNQLTTYPTPVVSDMEKLYGDGMEKL